MLSRTHLPELSRRVSADIDPDAAAVRSTLMRPVQNINCCIHLGETESNPS